MNGYEGKRGCEGERSEKERERREENPENLAKGFRKPASFLAKTISWLVSFLARFFLITC